MNIVIIAAEFNSAVTDVMIEVSLAEAESHGCKVRLVKVPGAYEIPLPASVLFAKRRVEALVTLGFIERGETLHGEVMGQVVHEALVRLSLEHRKPIGIGIIGPGATEEQAMKRRIGYARAAVRAALAMHRTPEEALAPSPPMCSARFSPRGARETSSRPPTRSDAGRHSSFGFATSADLIWAPRVTLRGMCRQLMVALLCLSCSGSVCEGRCTQFEVSGEWRTQQSNGFELVFDFKQTNTKVEGSARSTSTASGAQTPGVVEGTLIGDKLDFLLIQPSVIGRYSATVTNGVLSGQTQDVRGGPVVAWTGTGSTSCRACESR